MYRTDAHSRLIAALGIMSLLFCMALQRWKPVGFLRDKIVFAYNEEVPTFPASVYKSHLFGYEVLAANLLWIRFLQRSPVEKVPPNRYSWVYLDLDAISTLDPDFSEAFEAGGIYLSVIVEDKEGARKFLEKGVDLHPNNWKIRGNLAYHYQHELNLPDLAAAQYVEASKIPGAPWLFSVVAASGLKRQGKNEVAISLLERVLAATESEEFKNRIRVKLRELKGGQSAAGH
jgi:hypothetical protein